MLRIVIAVAALLSSAAPAQDHADPLTRPIDVDRAAEWLAPRPPVRLFGTSYLVGFAGLNVAMIDTGNGLILIDGALPQAAPLILSTIARLGFRPHDVKYILSTEPHPDHAGGLAALARDTGATVIASARGAAALRTGRLDADDPQRGYDSRFPAVSRVRALRDGDVLQLGKVRVTARATPGHTMGSMSWSWQACEARRCRSIVFASSLNPVSAEGYRFTAPASRPILAGYRRSYAAMKTMPCDILVTAHPNQGSPTERFVTGPGACRGYAEKAERLLSARLAKERG